MDIGIPREIKDSEHRVAITPAGVHELTAAGHTVFVEHDAGLGSSLADEAYESAGAKVLATAQEVWDAGELILKVKEPLPEEFGFLQRRHILFVPAPGRQLRVH